MPEAESAEAGAEEPEKSYDFYDMLPKFEVVVPEKDKDVRPDIKSVPETRRGTYVLQAGSYKNFAEADRGRAHARAEGIASHPHWPHRQARGSQSDAPNSAQGRCRCAGDSSR